MQRYFGHVGLENGGENIAVCVNCYSAVYMSKEYRSKRWGESITTHLSHIMECCDKPSYSFYPIYVAKDVPCPTCGQLEGEGGLPEYCFDCSQYIRGSKC